MLKNKNFLKSGQANRSSQKINKDWWNKSPMNYNWSEKKKDINLLSCSDLKTIDDNFFHIAKEFAHPNHPHEQLFNSFIDYKFIYKKNVLEVGCGLGSHASLLAKNCKKYIGVDIAEYSIAFSKKRFQLMDIRNGSFILADAEKIPYADCSFDYIWSWGVIHHSSNTEKIVSEIHRVLKKNGKATIMVYNKNSIRYYWYGIYQGIFRLKFLKYKSLYDINMTYTDGYIARHYTKKQLHLLFKNFYIENITVCDSGIASLGFGWHRLSKIFPYFTNKINQYLNKKFGWFLVVNIKKN